MAASSGYNDSDVVIVAAGRTPIGNLNGCLSSLKAHELGAIVIRDVLKRGKTPASDVAEVIMGQVCTAGMHKYAYMTNTRLNPFCFFSETASVAWAKATNSVSLQNFGISRGNDTDKVTWGHYVLVTPPSTPSSFRICHFEFLMQWSCLYPNT